MTFEKALRLVERYGKNSNSFMILYPGFKLFGSKNAGLEGVIGYVETRYAWIAGAEPLASEENQPKLLEEFAAAAAGAGKRVLVIPVDQKFAETAEAAGFRAVMIGSEPTFLLDRYPKSGTTWLDIVSTAKQLAGKGAVVQEFQAKDLTEERRRVLDELTKKWLGTRKTTTLGFLNQVHPWLHSELKKYFTIELDKKVLAFLAAIPIPARKGWYLIDTIRSEDSPAGTTELLLLQAMRTLREQGAEEITFGVAPLSGVEAVLGLPVARAEEHVKLYTLFKWIYEKGNVFYNFKPLFLFKMKFQPTVVRPVFMLYRSVDGTAGLSVKDVLSISQAWLPEGVAHAAVLGTVRLLSKVSIPDLIKSQLRPGTVVRSVPPTFGRLLDRCQITFFLILLNVAVSPRYLIAVILLVGALEYLAGSALTAAAYFGATLIPNVFSYLQYGYGGIDLSPGIFGVAGALYWFFKHGKSWIGLFVAFAVLTGLSGSGASYLSIVSHLTALALGIWIGKIVLRA